MEGHGSTLYLLSWRELATPAGRSICQLRASGVRTRDSASTSWPTPVREDARSSARHGYMIEGNAGTTLLDAARLTADPASWATPVATELGNTVENYLAMKRNMKSGPRKAITHPSLQAQLTQEATHGDWYEEQLALPETSDLETGSGSSTIPPGGGAVRGTWARDVEWIYCRPTPGNEDGCWRPVGSGVEPLAPGTSSDLGRVRTARLRGYGNSIVLPLATTFVEAVIETLVDAARALDVRAEESAA